MIKKRLKFHGKERFQDLDSANPILTFDHLKLLFPLLRSGKFQVHLEHYWNVFFSNHSLNMI
jgi:hypothetical protein